MAASLALFSSLLDGVGMALADYRIFFGDGRSGRSSGNLAGDYGGNAVRPTDPPGAVESHTPVRPVAGSATRWPLSLGSAVQPCELEAGVWSVALAAAMLAVAVAV